MHAFPSGIGELGKARYGPAAYIIRGYPGNLLKCAGLWLDRLAGDALYLAKAGQASLPSGVRKALLLRQLLRTSITGLSDCEFRSCTTRRIWREVKSMARAGVEMDPKPPYGFDYVGPLRTY